MITCFNLRIYVYYFLSFKMKILNENKPRIFFKFPKFPNFFGPENDKICRVRSRCFRNNWPWVLQGQLLLEWPNSKGLTRHKNGHPLYCFSIFFLWYLAGTQRKSWEKMKNKKWTFQKKKSETPTHDKPWIMLHNHSSKYTKFLHGDYYVI